MKHFSKVLFTLAFFAASYLFYACEPEEMVGDSSNSANDFTVRAKNGYLEFKDTTALNEVMTLLKDKDQEALDAWENQFPGFTSLRSINEQAIAAQEQWFEELRNMTAEERALLKAGDEDFWYSDFMKDHASSFILEDSGIYQINTTGMAHEMLGLINGDGIFKVGGVIYMHKRNTIKIIHDGDDSKIPLLLTTTESDDDLQISVYNDIMRPFKTKDNARLEFTTLVSNSSAGCADTDGDNRVTASLIVEIIPPDGWIGGYGVVRVEITNWYRDGIFGGYTRKKTSEMRIVGNLSIHETQGNTTANFSVNLNTGGDHRTQWGVTLWSGPGFVNVAGDNSYTVYADGSLIIYSRGGTSCGDISNPDPGENDQKW